MFVDVGREEGEGVWRRGDDLNGGGGIMEEGCVEDDDEDKQYHPSHCLSPS